MNDSSPMSGLFWKYVVRKMELIAFKMHYQLLY
jgi:hypothetical protein